MSTETKLRAIRRMEVKQLDEEARTFEGLASTWDRDLGDDVIKPGAFKKTIRDWKAAGRVLPLLDSHNWFSVRDAVGKLIDAKEVDEGLWTKWRIVPGADGDEIMHRLRSDEEGGGPFVDSMSIGYRAIKWEMDEDEDGIEIRVLKQIELHEVSLVLFPMNPEARIDSATVKQRLTAELDTVIERCRPGVRPELKSVLSEALAKCEGPACPNAVKGDAEELSLFEDTPKSDSEGDSDDPPDVRMLDQLRLRRLATLVSHHRGRQHHG
jgi:HK97 family phage prohead protease